MKNKCQYNKCKSKIQIGYYCWKHNPYSGMFDIKEDKKLKQHFKNKVKL